MFLRFQEHAMVNWENCELCLSCIFFIKLVPKQMKKQQFASVAYPDNAQGIHRS